MTYVWLVPIFTIEYSILNNNPESNHIQMTLIETTVRERRVDDFYALARRSRVSIKQICDHANLPVDSIYVNLREYKVSDERLDQLEESLHALINNKSNNSKVV